MLFMTSFRYCLGRRTYITQWFYDTITFESNWNQIKDETKLKIKKEILECNDLGMEMDKQYWLLLVKKIETELEA